MEGPANGQPWMAANTDRRPIATGLNSRADLNGVERLGIATWMDAG